MVTFYTLNSQNKDKVNIYLNEGFKTIEIEEFKRKKKSYLFYERIKQTDSATLHILKPTEVFGNLNDSIFNNFKKNYNLNINNNETLIIHFVDTLFGYKEFRKYKKPYHIYRMTNGDTVQMRISLRMYYKQRMVFDKAIKKCYQEAKKSNIKHLHLYETDLNDTYIYQNVIWHKINPELHDLFFKQNSGVLIIKPNGNFFKYTEIPKSRIKSILEFKDWNILINDYREALVSLPRKIKKRFKTKSVRRKYGKPLKIPRSPSKTQIRNAFEKNAFSHPVSSSCYSANY